MQSSQRSRTWLADVSLLKRKYWVSSRLSFRITPPFRLPKDISWIKHSQLGQIYYLFYFCKKTGKRIIAVKALAVCCLLWTYSLLTFSSPISFSSILHLRLHLYILYSLLLFLYLSYCLLIFFLLPCFNYDCAIFPLPCYTEV